jgi:hypothetical protein
MRIFAAVLLFLAVPFLSVCVSTAQAAPDARAQREIVALIDGLGASGCRFERNGSWYDAATAKTHLRKKYDYLRKRGMADTAELFIERAASESSMSGKPYHVQCPGRASETSAQWFRQKLQTLRATPAR